MRRWLNLTLSWIFYRWASSFQRRGIRPTARHPANQAAANHHWDALLRNIVDDWQRRDARRAGPGPRS